MLLGRVSFIDRRGFCFIHQEQSGQRFYAHARRFEPGVFDRLTPRTYVRFVPVYNDGGKTPEAHAIEVLEA
jgi:cold shock CspA family protein